MSDAYRSLKEAIPITPSGGTMTPGSIRKMSLRSIIYALEINALDMRKAMENGFGPNRMAAPAAKAKMLAAALDRRLKAGESLQ